jgi:hypothetical protein
MKLLKYLTIVLYLIAFTSCIAIENYLAAIFVALLLVFFVYVIYSLDQFNKNYPDN